MSFEHGMIEPFEASQVRQNQDAQKVISYGTSSYGYDVRCAAEFKIFTNINHAIVDPKDFDTDSFVDINSDVCIIPPNSFALARTNFRKSPALISSSPRALRCAFTAVRRKVMLPTPGISTGY